MKNLWFLVIAVFLSGCMTVRSYVVEKPRIDTEISGNRGYISGTPKPSTKTSRLGKTRKISVIEVEFGPRRNYGVTKRRVKDDEIDIVDEDYFSEKITYKPVKKKRVIRYKPKYRVKKGKYKYYVVKKNDTLQKISYKFYKTTKKWKYIYDYNKDVLKSPNKVYPGTKIKIPN